MDLIEKFNKLSTHAWYKKDFSKLRKKDLDFCHAWIKRHAGLNADCFAAKVNRMFLDFDSGDESKAGASRRRICQELISTLK